MCVGETHHYQASHARERPLTRHEIKPLSSTAHLSTSTADRNYPSSVQRTEEGIQSGVGLIYERLNDCSSLSQVIIFNIGHGSTTTTRTPVPQPSIRQTSKLVFHAVSKQLLEHYRNTFTKLKETHHTAKNHAIPPNNNDDPTFHTQRLFVRLK